jgi:hypothetical protein
LIARTIHDPQRFPRFRQRNQQWVVAPDAFVRHIHADFTFAGCLHDRSVHIDGCLCEEFVRLLRPHVAPSFINGRVQTVNVVMGFEASTKIASC